MCFYSLNSKPCIAKRNIVCYKVVDEDFNGPMLGMHYEIGKTYNRELEDNPKYNDVYEGYEISLGLHTYCSHVHATRGLGWWNTTLIHVRGWIGSGHGDHILKCIIPKGSLYYKNFEEIVSNQLKVVGKCV